MEPKISVALVTRNRPESLALTLASLRAQEQQPFEVIVSDDSDDEFAPRVAEVSERFGCTYQRGPRKGLYANRNAVSLACAGTHVRSMDDDHTFPPGHWAACEAAVRSDPEAIWTIGEYQDVSKIGVEPPFPACQLTPRGFGEEPRSPEAYWAISDGASIYPKSVFEKGHLYADCFVFGAAYLEFGSRLRWLGYRLRNLEATYVIHDHNPQARSIMSQEVDLSSRLFAMLCHSFRYQRSVKNMALTSAQFVVEIARHGKLGWRCARNGWRAFRGFDSRGSGTI